MQFVISGSKIRVFAKALHSLAKIGEDLYLNPQVDGLSLRTMNSARSAFLSYILDRSGFFDEYNLPEEGSPSTPATSGSDDSQAEEGTKCRLALRSIMFAFKSVPQLEKNVETCHFDISDADCKVTIELRCRFKVTKTFVLPFIEAESLKANYDLEVLTNRFTSRPRVLMDACLNFLTNQEEVTMSVSSSQFMMKNYVDEDDVKLNQVVRTEMVMAAKEFEDFVMDQDTTVTYCLKELRSIIGFADAMGEPLSACFNKAGEPIVFSLRSPGCYEGALVMATMAQEPAQNRYVKPRQPAVTNSQLNQSQQLSEASEPISFRRPSGGSKALPKESVRQPQRAQVRSTQDQSTVINSPQGSQLSETNSDVSTRGRVMVPSSPDKDQPNMSLDFDGILDQEESTMPGGRRRSSKRKEAEGGSGDDQKEGDGGGCGGEVVLPPSPPNRAPLGIDCSAPSAKRAKHLFKRCFEATFDPASMPGSEKILAPDSDEEDTGEAGIIFRKRRNKR